MFWLILYYWLNFLFANAKILIIVFREIFIQWTLQSIVQVLKVSIIFGDSIEYKFYCAFFFFFYSTRGIIFHYTCSCNAFKHFKVVQDFWIFFFFYMRVYRHIYMLFDAIQNIQVTIGQRLKIIEITCNVNIMAF